MPARKGRTLSVSDDNVSALPPHFWHDNENRTGVHTGKGFKRIKQQHHENPNTEDLNAAS